MEKVCNDCKQRKEISNFYKRSKRGDGSSGYFHICKKCQSEKKRNLVNFNKSEYMKRYIIENREKIKKYMKKYREKNSVKLAEARKIYYEINKENIKKKNYQYCKNRKKIDPMYKLKLDIRSLILSSFKLKFTEKSIKTTEILGCSYEDFKNHLEKQFDSKMNWENQGNYWHMDHIVPVSIATNEKELLKLNHYTNFQPLYWRDNLKKSDNF